VRERTEGLWWLYIYYYYILYIYIDSPLLGRVSLVLCSLEVPRMHFSLLIPPPSCVLNIN
jgi:hypothetical protein